MGNILVTGASGFLGESLVLSLSKQGYKLFSLGRSKSNLYCFDLSNEVPILNDSFDIVIHSAGKAHSVPRTTKEEKEFYAVNYQGTINFCDAINKLENKPKAFVFISTVAVYGLEEGININESNVLKGTTPYAKSKIQAEKYLQEWAKKNGITLCILRLPLIVGPNPPGNLGSMIKGIKTRKYLSIGNASAKKSMVWVEDIAKLIPNLAKTEGTYNLTDGYHPSFGELEKEISSCLGVSEPFKIPLWAAKVLGKIGDILGSKAPVNTDKLNKITSSLTFDDSKAKEKLEWNPTRVLDKISEII